MRLMLRGWRGFGEFLEIKAVILIALLDAWLIALRDRFVNIDANE